MTTQNNTTSVIPEKKRNILGERLLIAFYRLLSIAKLHQDNNQILKNASQEFKAILSLWIEAEVNLTFQISRGQFFLQEKKISFQRKNMTMITEFLELFEEIKVSGFSFNSAFNLTTLEQILAFARLMVSAAKTDDPMVFLGHELAEEPYAWVDLIFQSETSEIKNEEKLKETAQKTYSHALASLKDVSQKISSQDHAGISNLKRVVQKMVDFVVVEESFLMGMSTFREYDDYTYTHSVNVAILSLCLGKRIGLSRVSLSWLGICGLVHDLGKVDIPKEILNKPGKLTHQEYRVMQEHPLNSVRQILKLQASRELKTKIFLSPLEHHMKYDYSGYPRVQRKQSLSLFGKIISIADVFDALTSVRIYRPTAYSPDQVLGMMYEGSGKDFDPILLKVFINMLGVYPVGTVLELDTGEKGLVVRSATDISKRRPRIALLVQDGQGGYKKSQEVDLTEKDPKTGAFRRNIIKSAHSFTYGIQPAAVMF